MFNKNDVIRWRNTDYRLLGVVADTAALFPMNSTKLEIVTESVAELDAAEKSGAAALLEDPYLKLRFKQAGEKALEKMRSNYELIEPVLQLGDEFLLNPKARSRALNMAGGGNSSLRKKAVRALFAYLKKGQTETALLPEYGKNTAERNCRLKPGRRFGNSDINPPPVDEELRGLFSRCIDKYMLKPDGLSLKRTHALLVQDYIDVHPGTTPQTAPSYNQFRYFYRKYKVFPEKLKARTPAIQYDKDKRSLHGTVYDIVDGIGQIYEIDSTVAPVYLVAESDRGKIVGQPTIYLVTDVYSHMIVGVHVALEAAQFSTAAAALVNAFEDKVPFLEVYADHIRPELWKAQGLPHTITADNGELAGKQIEDFCRSANVRISNTKAYRGDQKGLVECLLGLVEERIAPHVKAHPSKVRLKKEGAKDLRSKASLTLSDYRKLVLNAAVDLNGRDVPHVPPNSIGHAWPTPTGIWDWCTRPGGGRSYLRRTPKTDLLKRSLMPRFDATVSREGLKAERIAYDCDRARELGWFERDRHAPRPGKLRIAIDPNNVSNAWAFPDEDTSPADAWPCRLASSSKFLERLPLFEARLVLDEYRRAAEKAELEHKRIQSEMYRSSEAIAKAAEAARPKEKRSAKEQLEHIAENRHEERDFQARKTQEENTPEPRRIRTAAPPSPYDYPDDFDELDG